MFFLSCVIFGVGFIVGAFVATLLYPKFATLTNDDYDPRKNYTLGKVGIIPKGFK